MKKFIYWTLFIVFVIVVLVWKEWPENGVLMTMCDVGQGDGFVFTRGFSQMVVDTGPVGGNISSCLSKVMPFWDKYIEVVLVTHADSDHLGGLTEILDRYRVGNVITTQASEQKVRNIVDNRCQVSLAWQKQSIVFGTISGDVLWPPKNYKNSDLNRQSIVLRLSVAHSNETVWMAGDTDEYVENILTESHLVNPSSILKIGHHGSASSSSLPFLSILQPRKILISVGKNNRYNHPAKVILDRIMGLGIPVIRTDEVGSHTIRF